MTDRLNPPHRRGLLAAGGGGGQVPLSWKYCLTVLDWAFQVRGTEILYETQIPDFYVVL